MKIESSDNDRANARRIFVSYAHYDQSLAQETFAQIFTYLRTLQHNDEMVVWSDKQIGTGRDWDRKIEAELRICDASILLIGPGFLNSNFIRNRELPAVFQSAERRGIPIFPVEVISVPWIAPWLMRLQTFGHGNPLEEDSGPALRKRLSSLIGEVHNRISQPSLAS